MKKSLHLTTNLADDVRTALSKEGSPDLKSSGFALAIFPSTAVPKYLVGLFTSNDFTGNYRNDRDFWLLCRLTIMNQPDSHRTVRYKEQNFGLAGVADSGLIYCILTGYADTRGVYDRLRSLLKTHIDGDQMIPHQLALI